MIQELQTAIYSRASGTSDFNTAIKQGDVVKFFFGQAPERIKVNGVMTDLTGEYAVFLSVSNPYSRDSGSHFETEYLQINIYENNKADEPGSTSSTHSLAKKCKALFDDCTLIITDYECVKVGRLNTVGPLRTGEGWMTAINYEIIIQKDK